MKKLGILLMFTFMFACSCEFVPNTDVHFVDEDFILTEKNEETMVIDGNTQVVRTWKIMRVTTRTDSLEFATIDDKGCDCIITDELWYDREVGATLHFDYILKSRFYKVANLNGLTYAPDYQSETTPMSISPEEVKATTVINMNKTEIELEVLKKERELMSLEREIEQLKENLN